MILVRLFTLTTLLLVVLLFVFRENLGLKIPDIKGLFTQASQLTKNLNLPNLPDNLNPKVPDLGSDLAKIASTTARLIQSPPDINSVTGLTQNLPQELQKNFPAILEIVTGSRKEELYFISPKNFILPQLEAKDYEQELKTQLFGFEVKDSRRSSRPWKLKIYVKEDSFAGSSLKKESAAFKLERNNIEPITALSEELTVEEGSELRIVAKPGRGKGTFKFNPILIVKIPPQSQLPTKLEIETEFE